ncbi:MAG: type II toxin-antitoxin system PrlF family antitoxin [Acidimicrobiaceae bacterium]|nr:type II toxin-antitoxin system PrlF family antitoxin [Acidimicrobiaceae bacterium]
MDIPATITSKGQVTIPKPVREALSLSTGDQIMFRVEQHRAIIARTPDLLEMAGIVEVPTDKRSAKWSDIRRTTRNRWAERAR